VSKQSYTSYWESPPTRKRKLVPKIVNSEKQAPMVLHGAEKETAEAKSLFTRYQRYQAHEYKLALQGEHGDKLRELREVLKKLTLDDGDPLLDLMSRYRWLLGYDLGLRRMVLQMIDDAICRLRVQHGLAFIDDALPGEEPTVFQICRTELTKGDPP
jgi:cell fate (sporulation/competence/biofilm development) regulator YlbF (YheA/YmcA/DUF963 family)